MPIDHSHACSICVLYVVYASCIHRIQQEQLTSLEQEQRELENKIDQVKMSMDNAKSDQRNAQTHLSRLQQDEFRVKQVDNIMHCIMGNIGHHLVTGMQYFMVCVIFIIAH